MKKHSKALVFFAVSKQIPIVYSADRGRAEIIIWFGLIFSENLCYMHKLRQSVFITK